MGKPRKRKLILLPSGWSKPVKSGLLHAISFAFNTMTVARSKAAISRNMKHRLQADLDQALTDNALLREKPSIKDARWIRVPPRRRPYYSTIQRMRIVKLKAARG